MLALLLVLLGVALCARPLPPLTLPPPRSRQDLTAILETFVDSARAGVPTPTALQQALHVNFLPDEALTDFIASKFVGDPIAEQFAAMWRTLHRRGSGIVDGAAVLAKVSQERRAQDEELEAKSSGARATFRLLVLLPLWFLFVGQLIGLPALSVLLTHFWGYLLLAIAAALMWIGHRWMAKILAAV